MYSSEYPKSCSMVRSYALLLIKLFTCDVGSSITEESARIAVRLDYKRFGQFCSKREGQ